jgi:RNA polymerase sigma-70 factor, ECF subfamily
VNARAQTLFSVDADDAQLVNSCEQGQRQAFAILMQRHQKMVNRVLSRFLKNKEDADDLTQKTFTNVYRVLNEKGLNGAPFRAYVIRVALNLAHNHRRDTFRWVASSVENLLYLKSAAPLADQRIEDVERAALIANQVKQLPLKQKEVFSLRIDGELSFAEIGEALSISEDSAKANFHLALKKLREQLKENPNDL